MKSGLLGIAVLSGCAIDLNVPADALIACGADADCPDDFVCVVSVQRCAPDVDDDDGPRVLAAFSPDATTVEVSFDEPVDVDSASEPGRYVILPALGVDTAKPSDDGQTVTLHVAPQRGGTAYVLTVEGVEDWYGNPVGSDDTAEFTGFGTPPDGPPRTR